MKISNKKYSILIALVLTQFSCTKLDEKLNSTLTQSQAESSLTATQLLTSAYYSVQPAFIDVGLGFWSLQEHPSDEMAGPTRATDWDDNGKWRALHQHTWDGTHVGITNAFENLLILQYDATNVLRFNPSKQVAAEAKFLRDFSMFCVLDGWGQVPFREYTDDLKKLPKVYKDSAALNFIITELNSILPDLPTRAAAAPNQANQDAARILLMKCYLNKGTFLHRKSPTFDASDMQMVITLANQIKGYSLTSNYYDNFSPLSGTNSTENIFGFKSSSASNAAALASHGEPVGDVVHRWMPTLHYNQNPSGWNGFCTLSAFYNKFLDGDIRKSATFAGLTEVSGLKAGFLIGQQYNQKGDALKDKRGNPLAYTAAINPTLKETDPNTLEVTGIRVLKFIPQYVNGVAKAAEPANVIPFFRYADVLLMQAEALFRIGQPAEALTIVNSIRTTRKTNSLTSLTLANILDERGRELYWEGWRREDQIRFGTFLLANEAKPNVSDPKYLIFPIPINDLASDANLTQNEGY